MVLSWHLRECGVIQMRDELSGQEKTSNVSYRKALVYLSRSIKNPNENNSYLKIKELVERATPKPVNKKSAIMSYLKTHILLHTGNCPICDKAVSHSSYVEKDGLFCDDCGQALDWGTDDE